LYIYPFIYILQQANMACQYTFFTCTLHILKSVLLISFMQLEVIYTLLNLHVCFEIPSSINKLMNTFHRFEFQKDCANIVIILVVQMLKYIYGL